MRSNLTLMRDHKLKCLQKINVTKCQSRKVDGQREWQCMANLKEVATSQLWLLPCRNRGSILAGLPTLNGKSKVWIFIINLPIFKYWQWIWIFKKPLWRGNKICLFETSTLKIILLKIIVYFFGLFFDRILFCCPGWSIVAWS